jgi:cytochrome c-type biogenesis protein CcmE
MVVLAEAVVPAAAVQGQTVVAQGQMEQRTLEAAVVVLLLMAVPVL